MRATRHSFKNSPLPQARARLTLRRTFSAAELGKLADGFIPDSMDDKWFVFMEGDALSFHRSWTGICIYQLRLSGHDVAEAWVNRDRDEYGGDNDAKDLSVLERLLDEFSGRRG